MPEDVSAPDSAAPCRAWLDRHGWDVLPRPFPLSAHPSSVLQPTLSMLLFELAACYPQPHIIQVGAYDGNTGDPLARFLQASPVRAVLLEPQPGPCSALQSRYADRPDIQVLPCAVAAIEGTQSLYVLAGTHERDPWWAPQIASFERSHLLKHAAWIPDLESRIAALPVPTLTPQSLMARLNSFHCDALIVDAEGADWKIVSLFLDAGIIPAILFFEWRHLDPSELRCAVQRLLELGFQMEFVDADLLARLPDELDRTRRRPAAS